MEGHGFLKHFSGDLSIVNGNCEIHKVDRVASFHEYPFEAMITVDCGLKVVPAIIVDMAGSGCGIQIPMMSSIKRQYAAKLTLNSGRNDISCIPKKILAKSPAGGTPIAVPEICL